MSQNILSGRTCLVTGASSGIGRASALALGAAGARVAVNHFNDRDAAEEVVASIRSGGGEAFAHEADVADEEQVKGMFAKMVDKFGRLDALINNAGIQKDADLIDMTFEDWEAVIRTNLQGGFLCAREAARHFCERARSENSGQDRSPKGNMIFVGSVHGVIPWAGHVNYAASKGGLSMLMKSIAQELGPERVRVNEIAPGAIQTDINRDVWEDDQERQKLLKKIPYGRLGTPDDVARAIVWLVSDESDYVHGHTLCIGGGMMLYPGFREAG